MTIIKKSTSNSKIEVISNEGEPFPESAQKMLNALYDARGITEEEDKKNCIREIFGLLSEENQRLSLKEIEFYFLTKCKVL